MKDHCIHLDPEVDSEEAMQTYYILLLPFKPLGYSIGIDFFVISI